MRVISLGWGVQSFTLAAMAALGEIEPVDYAIHADTRYEFSLTYEFAGRWTKWLNARGVKVVTVQDTGPSMLDRVIKKNQVYIPAYSTPVNGSQVGMMHRQCTGHWKIAPIRRFLQQHRHGKKVEMLLGISTDEWQRMRQPDVLYIQNSYPLIDKRMSRMDCITWLNSHHLEIPPKSACYFCPYRSDKEWGEVKKSVDWDLVVDVDQKIRNTRLDHGFLVYLHRAGQPIEEIDFRSLEDRGQLTLWDKECSGMCGV